ncbi:MAG TPA: alpha/beta hydrolase [Sediminibacterium sp.]|nr:alpha/beta hydrolase [Sediminibacterium sp.]HQS53556.1 alpha/beta hydrolase [Sediminibacterium sp.]
MKKISLLICLLAFMHISQAQSIVGIWQGFLGVGGRQIRFVMHVEKTGNEYRSSFDSPDQNSFGLQGSKTDWVADSILVEIKTMNAGYRGLWNGKDSIYGNFKQGNFKTALNMKRVEEKDIPKPPTVPVRPQTPKAPFGYLAEEVIYKNADSSLQYGATFTKPSQGTNFPTVILISGSGTQDRDGTMFGHKTYAVLADLLTKQGIAVLRVDDRGIGKSSLGPNPSKLTSVDFAGDVNNSIHYLMSRPDVDKKKIGLIGHSEGGMIAPMVAVNNKQVAFIVLLAGPGQKGLEIWNFQMIRSFESVNLSASDKELADSLIINMNAPFAKYTDLSMVESEMKLAYANWKKSVSDDLEKKIFFISPQAGMLAMAKQFQGGLAWLNYFLNYQPSTNLEKLKIPVLALNGTFDIQVTSDENLLAIEAALKKGRNKKYEVHAIPGLNHLFQTAKTKVQTYDTIDETFSPEAANLIGAWILKTTH